MRPYTFQGSNPYTPASSICAAAIHATGRDSGHFVFRRNRFPGVNVTFDVGNVTHPHNVTSLVWPGEEVAFIRAET
eukprot:SAG31_NODE_46879_length_252_cov_1.267974_1_plen_75_part_10